MSGFWDRGWARFGATEASLDWAAAAREAGVAVAGDPDWQAAWLRCQGTWFAGVDALPNDAAGAVAGSGPLSGPGVAFLAGAYGGMPPLHKGQLSVIYPGYPRPLEGESPAAGRYRIKRDAAHVDGLLPVGPERRRQVQEPHAWVLGVALNAASAAASPLVVWEGSHEIMRAAFADVFAGVAPEDMGGVDVTAAYQAARARCFDVCPRVPVPLAVGETVAVHRFALHGMAPWGDGATAPGEGRMIAYFRPEFSGGVAEWLAAR